MNKDDVILGIKSQLKEEDFPLANLANFLAFIFELPDISWAGVYLHIDGELILGPFQGRPACNRIAPSKGVCGQAFAKKETLRVEDVHAFSGHISCDPGSKSELVIPILVGDRAYGVLDLDSYKEGRFSPEDQIFFEEALKRLNQSLDWVKLIEGLEGAYKPRN
ncbi:MAG: GAF domain-containing protein [Tissierellia bacterium]|nr:GAF domain-containing protein [Tissierellia bacterium]